MDFRARSKPKVYYDCGSRGQGQARSPEKARAQDSAPSPLHLHPELAAQPVLQPQDRQLGQRHARHLQGDQHARVRSHVGPDEVQPKRRDELREDEQGHALPLRQPEQERPPGHGQGEAAGLPLRRVGDPLEARRGPAEELSHPRTLQTKSLSVDQRVRDKRS